MLLHELLLLGGEATFEEAFEGRVGGSPHEEDVAGHEVEGSDVEANGFHDVP